MERLKRNRGSTIYGGFFLAFLSSDGGSLVSTSLLLPILEILLACYGSEITVLMGICLFFALHFFIIQEFI